MIKWNLHLILFAFFLMTQDASSQIHKCVHYYDGIYWLWCICNNAESSDLYYFSIVHKIGKT